MSLLCHIAVFVANKCNPCHSSPVQCQTIIWTISRLLSIQFIWITFIEIPMNVWSFYSNKMQMKILSTKRWPFCCGLNIVLRNDEVSKGFPESRPLFTKGTDVLPPNLVKSRRHGIECYFAMWRASRLRYCRGACQVSEWLEKSKPQSY